MFSPARSLRSGKRRRGSKISCFPEIGEFVPKRPQGGGRFAPAPHKRRSHLALIRRERVNRNVPGSADRFQHRSWCERDAGAGGDTSNYGVVGTQLKDFARCDSAPCEPGLKAARYAHPEGKAITVSVRTSCARRIFACERGATTTNSSRKAGMASSAAAESHSATKAASSLRPSTASTSESVVPAASSTRTAGYLSW